MYDEYDENFDERSYYDERRKRKAAQARVRRNREKGLAFEGEMFIEESRWLLIFLTCNVQKQYRQDITFPMMQRLRDKFFHNMESDDHRLLGGIHGVIWKLEEGGRGGGLHLHLLIFYRGDRRDDVRVCKMLGDYWVRVITKGWGDYWNSNARRGEFEKRWGDGIGQVNRHDRKRDSLQAFIANYMAKSTQVPRERSGDDKLFGIRFFDRKR
jgi:hypothetical protein